MNHLVKLLFFTCFLFTSTLYAQEAEPERGSLDEGTIDSQYEYLNRISSNYQEYKVVRKTLLDKFKSNVTDSLNVFKNQLVETRQEIASQKSQIEELKTSMETTQADLKEAINAKDSFSFFDIYIHKSTYNSLVWGIIIILAIAMLLFLFRYKQSFKIISETKRTLEETREEFDLHRKNTLERERKLNRQLVDEINKRQAQ